MKHLIYICLLVGSIYSIKAQNNSNELVMFIKNNIRIDSLFKERKNLVGMDSSTRNVDRELAALGVKFPAEIEVSNMDGNLNITFLLLEDYGSDLLESKIDNLKKSVYGLKELGINRSSHHCYATFSEGTPMWKIEHLLAEFLYDGYYFSSRLEAQIGTLNR